MYRADYAAAEALFIRVDPAKVIGRVVAVNATVVADEYPGVLLISARNKCGVLPVLPRSLGVLAGRNAP